jgi:general bacterial porin, GBP family
MTVLLDSFRRGVGAAAAGFCLTGAACAQTTVTVYGIVDVAVARASNGDGLSRSELVSGQGSASRLGFRGSEDLGDGLRALFALEGALNPDTGTGAGTGGAFNFARQAWVGLAGRFGQLSAGRQFRPEARVVFAMDPFDAGSVASPPNTYSNTVFRADNAIVYETPRFAGLLARAMYAFGENAGGVGGALNDVGFALQYNGGPIYAAYGYDGRRNAAASARREWHSAGGSYDFGVAKLYAAWRTRKEPVAGLDERSGWLGLSVPIGPATLQGTVGRVDDRTAANKDARGISLGAEYALSKRTDVYGRSGRVSNRNGATFNLDNGLNGSRPMATAVGLRHRF